MDLNFVFIIAVFVVVFTAAALVLFNIHRERQAAYIQHAQVHCQACDASELLERESGSYACKRCGFDQEATYSGDAQALLHDIQETSMALAVLESAEIELSCSREREETYRDNKGRQRTRTVGPFPERFTEGIEQAHEAFRLTERLADQLAIPPGAYRDHVGAAADLPYNDCAERAAAHTRDYLQVVQQLRDALRARVVSEGLLRVR